ncbi:hypothetical protein G6M78_03965 [Agrobacterium tumefaciens]|uniref:retron St85 family RNA-directed DNA polymerase n=1 Tax=Agrobacterium tumefaciens TaxID=358 RepID=UPI0015737AD4|nr:retron St85 family RNA-directed DNA polymerase [Agrobacterium tumefaciens]NTE54228.1 hypothetical protein [Agrobacterium tumefaciens]NTE70393.1 hypothetical protein [Agrobacterium tumefaciens]
MPTRSYYFPSDFRHLDEIIKLEVDGLSSADLDHFRNLNMPPLLRAGTIAIFLGISPKTIYSIRRNQSKHYRSFCMKKSDGSLRNIDTPRTYLKVVQWWILDNILNKVVFNSNIFGFVPGRSAIQNAQYHMGAQHLLNVDIQDFFPSISIERVRAIFSTLGFNEEVATVLSELCCLHDRLPQGAPTSPAIANLVLRDLDSDLSRIAEAEWYKYSRYADDLTFSSMTKIEDTFLDQVYEAVNRAGFALKPAKTRFSGRGGRMEVTGVVINEKLQPSRDWRKTTRSKLHRLRDAARLTRKEVAFLFGIKGMSVQFPDSPQMQSLAFEAENILKQKSHTVIGRGKQPVLPSGLTLRQAEVLIKLRPHKTNAELAYELGTTEAAVKKRLQEVFKKVSVTDRIEAKQWADENL